MNKSIIGLNKEEVNDLVVDLNVLLANFQLFYQNLRGLHWNIKGKSFFELHLKFEEFYTDAQIKVDLIAERILTLQGIPLHTFTDYESLALIPIGKNISKDTEGVQLVVDSLQRLIEIERKILIKSANANDEGTNTMMSDFIAEQEKIIWMLMAWLS